METGSNEPGDKKYQRRGRRRNILDTPHLTFDESFHRYRRISELGFERSRLSNRKKSIARLINKTSPRSWAFRLGVRNFYRTEKVSTVLKIRRTHRRHFRVHLGKLVFLRFSCFSTINYEQDGMPPNISFFILSGAQSSNTAEKT